MNFALFAADVAQGREVSSTVWWFHEILFQNGINGAITKCSWWLCKAQEERETTKGECLSYARIYYLISHELSYLTFCQKIRSEAKRRFNAFCLVACVTSSHKSKAARMLKILLVLIICGMCRARTSKDLRVRTEDGRVIGRYMTSVSGRTIRAFMGIPYAEPPVDDLRFRPPVNKKIYMGVLMAHEEPPMCLQADPFARSRKLQGQEDCLYLNVYAPEVDNIS